MSKKAKSIFDNIDFNVFPNELNECIKNSIEKFWETDVDITVRAINNFREFRDEKIASNLDFFSSQIKVENHKPVIIRLSSDFVRDFLSSTLESSTQFNLSSITQLEVRILNDFTEFLYKRMQEKLIPVKNIKLSENSDKLINLFYYVKIAQSMSLFAISIPMDRLNLAQIKKKQTFNDEDFLTSNTNVKIKVGTSKITLKDLENLSSEDIILLENSEITKSTLISGDLVEKFNVKINPALILNLEEDDNEEINEQINNEVTMNKNLWDDIQVEISAEFDKVKMSLGELKQITQGEIIDLNSIFETKISLFVEDKKVASGDLLIINDRYAVKLDEVLADTKKVQTKAPEPEKKVEQKPQPKPAQAEKPQVKVEPKAQNTEEEFDYSDFEK